MPVAIPLVMAAVSAAGSVASSKIAANAAAKRSAEEQKALGGAQGAAGDLAAAGKAQLAKGNETIGQGLQTMAPAASYFGALLHGNRTLQSQATAAPRAGITDTYRGAERNLERSGVRGASRDVASAELGRQRAGQISSLISGVQPGAASAVAGIGREQAGIGTQQASLGAPMLGQSGSLYGNLLGQGFQNRAYGNEQGAQIGRPVGGFLYDLLSGVAKRRGQSSAGPALSMGAG